MYTIRFYRDSNGNEPVREYIDRLAASGSKDSRIKLAKIRDYIKLLSEQGTYIGRPYVSHLDGDIWELRPLRDRILFAAWGGNEFLLLHHFMKQTQKAPKREIEKAKKELKDYRERSDGNE